METFAEWGYLGLFVACFIAATLIPMASEIVLSLFILTNYDFTTSIIVASLGSWVGGMSSYYLGWLGRWDIVEKYSKLTKEKIKSYQSKIKSWGGLIAFLVGLQWLVIH
ncbi:MAG: YqaA family protein [Flavobacteriaceae bacterium]